MSTEARHAAARLCQEAIVKAQWPDDPAIVGELQLILGWLRRRGCEGDPKLTAALKRETGRQVHPTGRAAQKMERELARKSGEKPRG